MWCKAQQPSHSVRCARCTRRWRPTIAPMEWWKRHLTSIKGKFIGGGYNNHWRMFFFSFHNFTILSLLVRWFVFTGVWSVLEPTTTILLILLLLCVLFMLFNVRRTNVYFFLACLLAGLPACLLNRSIDRCVLLWLPIFYFFFFVFSHAFSVVRRLSCVYIRDEPHREI